MKLGEGEDYLKDLEQILSAVKIHFRSWNLTIAITIKRRGTLLMVSRYYNSFFDWKDIIVISLSQFESDLSPSLGAHLFVGSIRPSIRFSILL